MVVPLKNHPSHERPRLSIETHGDDWGSLIFFRNPRHRLMFDQDAYLGTKQNLQKASLFSEKRTELFSDAHMMFIL